MCIDCFDELADDPAISPEELARLARHIEADMSGERLGDRAWAIYFGEQSGALDWRELDRIARALEGARVMVSAAGTSHGAAVA